MAIFVAGMECVLCHQTMRHDEPVVLFSPFVWNEADPLLIFHDATVHRDCLTRSSLGAAALERQAQYQRHNVLEARKCRVCGKVVLHPDEYLFLPWLTDDAGLPLARYSFSHFHIACFNGWQEREQVARLAQAELESEHWRGRAAERLVQRLTFGVDRK